MRDRQFAGSEHDLLAPGRINNDLPMVTLCVLSGPSTRMTEALGMQFKRH